MRINREELLNVLESVSPGLAQREIIEQSSCLVFFNEKVCTFNDEIACFRKSPLKIEGAVRAAPFLALLNKLKEDQIDIELTDSGLSIKGKKRKANLVMEQEVSLPVKDIEIPEDWIPIDPELSEAVRIVHSCASSDESEFILTCVHIHPDYLEACDRFQIARYLVNTGLKESILVRAESLKKILGYDMTEMSETSSWLHFKNPAGLVLSLRKHVDDYKSLDAFLEKDDITPMKLPGGLEEVVANAEIFSVDNTVGNRIIVNLKTDRILIEGQGVSGWYKEMKSIQYSGEPIKFKISPKLLIEVSKKANECGVGKGRLFVDTGKLTYVTSTEID